MCDALPPPLVPPEVNLAGFEFMPFDVRRMLRSETWVLGSGDECRAALSLWMESWEQIPAGSLPDNDKMLAHLSQAGARWGKVKAHALRGWVKCSDGRLYHKVVCEKALEAWIEKLSNSLSGAAGNAKRWGVDVDTSITREQFVQAVETLRAIAPQSRTLKKKIVATITAASPPDRPPITTRSPKDRKGQGQGQGQGQGHNPPPPPGGVGGEGDPGDDDPPEAGGQPKTPAGAVCGALRRAGIPNTNPGHPRLLTLLDAGATPPEFLAFAAKAIAEAADPFAYVLGAVEGERKRAASTAEQLHRGPMPVADDHRARQGLAGALLAGAIRPPQQPKNITEVLDVESRLIAP